MKRTKSRSSGAESANRLTVKAVIFGVVPGIIFTVVAILLFALLMKIFAIAETAIPAVNQVIKIFGIAIVAYIITKRLEVMPWLWSGIGGAVYILAGHIMFSLIDGNLLFSLTIFSDIGMGFIIGVIVSLILGFIKKQN